MMRLEGRRHWHFLCHTHTHKRPLDSHHLRHLQRMGLHSLPVHPPAAAPRLWPHGTSARPSPEVLLEPVCN